MVIKKSGIHNVIWSASVNRFFFPANVMKIWALLTDVVHKKITFLCVEFYDMKLWWKNK